MIIDDEPPAIRVLEKYIAEAGRLNLVAVSTDPVRALAVLQREEIDLLFLDINMPRLSGISLVRSLPNPPLVIFTTAYPEFAVEGFELEALDYLVKPFSFERFLKAVNKASERLEQEKKLRNLARSPSDERLLLRADRKLHNIRFDDILYLQAFGDYVRIFTKNGNFTPKEKLSAIEERLPKESFLRIHRSYIVALDAVEYIEGNHVNVNNEKIPIGQAYKEELIRRLN